MTFLFCSGSFILLLCVINCRKTFILNCAYVEMNYRPQQNSAHRCWPETHKGLTLSALTCQISVRRRFDELSNQAYMYCLQFFLLLSVPGNAVMVLSVAVSLELWRSRLETSGHQSVSAVIDITPWRQHPNNFLFGSRAEKLQSLAECLAKFSSARYGPPFLF